MEKSKFEQLPHEIIFKIFSNCSISAEDLISLSNVCKRFQNVCHSEDKLWKSKFQQRWPLAWKKIKSSEVENWKKEVEDSLEISKRLEEILNSLSDHLSISISITSPILNSIFQLLNVTNHGPFIVISDLLKIIKDSSLTDSTTLYFAKEVLHQVNYYFWSEKLRKFFTLQRESQSLEKGLFYFAKWFSSEDFFGVDYEEVSLKLDQLTSEVQLHLKTKYPTHPAATIKLFSPEEPLKNSSWPDEMCSQIFRCIKHIMFTEHNYEIYDENTDLFSSKFLRRILGYERYVPIIFQAVSHRLGIPLIFMINEDDDLYEYILGWKSRNSEIFDVMHPLFDIVEWDDLSDEKKAKIFQKICKIRRLVPNLTSENFDFMVDEDEEEHFAAAAMIQNLLSLTERL